MCEPDPSLPPANPSPSSYNPGPIEGAGARRKRGGEEERGGKGEVARKKEASIGRYVRLLISVCTCMRAGLRIPVQRPQPLRAAGRRTHCIRPIIPSSHRQIKLVRKHPRHLFSASPVVPRHFSGDRRFLIRSRPDQIPLFLEAISDLRRRFMTGRQVERKPDAAGKRITRRGGCDVEKEVLICDAVLIYNVSNVMMGFCLAPLDSSHHSASLPARRHPSRQTSSYPATPNPPPCIVQYAL